MKKDENQDNEILYDWSVRGIQLGKREKEVLENIKRKAKEKKNATERSQNSSK